MSAIARTALRIAAVEAILGKTLAVDRVFDSAIDALDAQLNEEERRPIITVTTDDDVRQGKVRDTWSNDRKIDLVIEIAVASKVTAEGIVIPETDFGLEWSLDIIEHQIERALFSEDSAWGKVFMGLVLETADWKSRRGASADAGLRFAARQINITLDVVQAPLPGEAITEGPYQDLFTAMAGQPDRVELGSLLRAVLEGTDKPEWERLSEAIGLRRAEAASIGIAPVDLTEAGEPAEMEQSTIIDDDHEDGSWSEPEA